MDKTMDRRMERTTDNLAERYSKQNSEQNPEREAGKKPPGELDALWHTLRHPGAGDRSLPFWGWNARLEKENLCFQMSEMKEQGMGGFFIHSREGLETEYLSDEWMEDVAACTKQAEQDDMELWIYDEDKWPSGAAGGKVSALDPEKYAAKALTMELVDARPDAAGCITDGKPDAGGDIMDEKSDAVRNSVGIESGYVGIYDLTPWGYAGQFMILRQETSADSMWYNGSAPTDMLKMEAAEEFLRLTHERYREYLGASFDTTVRGFFTDEPNFCDFFSCFTKGRPWLPWTGDLVREFASRRGYSPMEHLPGLFLEGEASAQIRHDYWRTLTELFSERYMRPVSDWCASYGKDLAGHLLYENDLGYQARVCGAVMPHYRYLQVPGIDILGEQTKEYLTVKQCTSVANQYGRRDVVAEVYGCTGWEFGFEGQKWLGDWLYVQGVTRRCQHMAQYSIAGCRKRDYPPVFQYQTTWWKDLHLMEEYFARLSACVKTGEVVREILVLHPISSIWTMCGSAPDEDLNHVHMNMGWLDPHITKLNEWGEQYNRLAALLLGAHLDFDFGDETLLAEIGKVEGDRLKVGRCRYHTVVVPDVLSLFESTVRLLEAFAKAGGHLIWVGAYPELLEGRKSLLAEELLSQCPVCHAGSYEELPDLIRGRQDLSMRVLLQEGGEAVSVLTMLRKTDDGYLLFAVNNDRDREQVVQFHLPMTGRVEAYDAWTDSRCEVSVELTRKHSYSGMAAADTPDTWEKRTDANRACSIESAGMRFTEVFAPAMSKVYFIRTAESPAMGTADYPYRHPHYTDEVFAMLGPQAAITRTMPNVLTLDRCRYVLGDPEIRKHGTDDRYGEEALSNNGANCQTGMDSDTMESDLFDGCNGKSSVALREALHDENAEKLPGVCVSEDENEEKRRGICAPEEMEIWQAQKEIRERLGMQQVYYNGAPQRYQWVTQPAEGDGTPFALDFRFDVEELPETACQVVMEKPEGLRIYCNGYLCGEASDGFFMDRDMRRIPLSHLKKGENHLLVSGNYRNNMELEDIYIIGDFAVSPERKITRERGTLHLGDWCLQGY